AGVSWASWAGSVLLLSTGAVVLAPGVVVDVCALAEPFTRLAPSAPPATAEPVTATPTMILWIRFMHSFAVGPRLIGPGASPCAPYLNAATTKAWKMLRLSAPLCGTGDLEVLADEDVVWAPGADS